MFRKTYYSKHDVGHTLEADLHWIEQTKAEFELGIFQGDTEGVKEKIEKTANFCGLELIVTEPDKSIAGNQIILFVGRKKVEWAQINTSHIV